MILPSVRHHHSIVTAEYEKHREGEPPARQNEE